MVEPIALAADYLIFLRGAERSFVHMAAAFPEAPIYTIAYSSRATDGRFEGRAIRTSYLQRVGLNRRWYRYALPLLPRAAESLPVAGYPVVVSSSFGFAHGVRPSPGARHVCYCHSPFRQAWHENARALAATPRLARRYAARSLARMREWDLAAARRVTTYVANSAITRERVAELYGRDSEVLHPPVEVDRFKRGVPEDYFLYVGELVAHKRPEAAIEAARLAGRPIVVVGEGPERGRLRARYGEHARFLGRVGDRELAGVYSRALALVMPNVEEFGIVAVEAQAAGRPVLAVGRGGARETVIDGVTGILLDSDDPRTLAEAMREVDFGRFDPSACRRNAERFAAERFRARLREIVARTPPGAG